MLIKQPKIIMGIKPELMVMAVNRVLNFFGKSRENCIIILFQSIILSVFRITRRLILIFKSCAFFKFKDSFLISRFLRGNLTHINS